MTSLPDRSGKMEMGKRGNLGPPSPALAARICDEVVAAPSPAANWGGLEKAAAPDSGWDRTELARGFLGFGGLASGISKRGDP